MFMFSLYKNAAMYATMSATQFVTGKKLCANFEKLLDFELAVGYYIRS